MCQNGYIAERDLRYSVLHQIKSIDPSIITMILSLLAILACAHAAPAGFGNQSYCLVFQDDFNGLLDTATWKHDVTMGGGGYVYLMAISLSLSFSIFCCKMARSNCRQGLTNDPEIGSLNITPITGQIPSQRTAFCTFFPPSPRTTLARVQ